MKKSLLLLIIGCLISKSIVGSTIVPSDELPSNNVTLNTSDCWLEVLLYQEEQSKDLVSKESNGEKKPRSCQYCGKSFARVGHLTVHERIHTGCQGSVHMTLRGSLFSSIFIVPQRWLVG